MQDGATPHTANSTVALLKTLFQRRVISSKFHMDWPAHSPDCNPCDFFFWNMLKKRVYGQLTNYKTINHLKRAIRYHIRELNKNWDFGHITPSVLDRFQRVVNKEGERV